MPIALKLHVIRWSRAFQAKWLEHVNKHLTPTGLTWEAACIASQCHSLHHSLRGKRLLYAPGHLGSPDSSCCHHAWKSYLTFNTAFSPSLRNSQSHSCTLCIYITLKRSKNKQTNKSFWHALACKDLNTTIQDFVLLQLVKRKRTHSPKWNKTRKIPKDMQTETPTSVAPIYRKSSNVSLLLAGRRTTYLPHFHRRDSV